VALLNRALVRALPAVPKVVVRRLSSRYIAGPSLEDAARVVARLNGEGKMATVDVLGEEIRSADEARQIARAYHEVFARIDGEGLDANVSIKLTALGLELDKGICREQVEGLVRDAGARGNFVRIDMEDSSTTDATLRLYRDLRSSGFENVGVVLQSRLRRTLADVAGLHNVRLCKGIYLEPAAVAFQDGEEIRTSFRATLAALLDQGSYVGIATHDEALITHALAQVRERRLAREQYEFQMLLGVRPERGDELVRDGHRLRVYVPFGKHWYEYSLRRLQENPAIAGYVAADIFRGLGRPRRGGRKPKRRVEHNLIS
jgi:proline dehydrogenase